MMERSFSILENDEEVTRGNLEDSDEEILKSGSFSPPALVEPLKNALSSSSRPVLSSPGPSNGRRTVVRSRSPRKDQEKLQHLVGESSESDSDLGVKGPVKIPGEYDASLYAELDVDDETKEVFQYILKYTPQQLSLDQKFKPFVLEFLPAVGDIDAFLKVVPPQVTISGDKFNKNDLDLGLKVLDEPCSNQSDPALLHLQLRASSSTTSSQEKNTNLITKKIDNVEKNVKVIDKWIKDISDLHKSKASPVVRYSQAMPDLDDLMQEWPEDTETFLKENGFPVAEESSTLLQYLTTICELFKIPLAKNPIQSVHLLFCLFEAIKSTQLYQNVSSNNEKTGFRSSASKSEAPDQLVLE